MRTAATRMGNTAIRAGRSVRVKRSDRSTPAGVKIPKWLVGRSAAGAKESRPPAVVSEVMTIGRPEWASA